MVRAAVCSTAGPPFESGCREKVLIREFTFFLNNFFYSKKINKDLI